MREAGLRVQPNLRRFTVASIIRTFRNENSSYAEHILCLNSVQSGKAKTSWRTRTLVYRCTKDCNYKYGFGQQCN
ncbi:hypothetical protein J4Q44_G00137640 [Coregonus suidteri]|uniref:Uncharacterized protein n=1 Tax=Coregonus suidteri TaxID=861788 RepID=A0AAN8M0R4_9TELE